tara:strand:+ start:666 stop:1037 length:372 start_codon:yes stop_codon:yes gene_type:complete
MASLADRVYDNGLQILDQEASRLDICSQEPTTYAEATTTYTLGNATSISIDAPSDRTGGGRKVSLQAISGGAVSATGSATHYALTDVSNTRLLATGSLTSPQSVTANNTFATAALDIGIPDPA